MTATVKPDRRAARRAETEARLIAAATELFLARGYTATTLADVAEHASWDLDTYERWLHTTWSRLVSAGRTGAAVAS